MDELKKSIKFLWHIVKFTSCIILILATFYYGYSYLNKIFINKDVYYNDSFHNMPSDSVDVVVLGSSHAQYSFIPSYAYQDAGLYSYVLGTACQPLKVSYQMLKEALKTQSPELVILEVFTGTPLRSSCMSDTCYVTAAYQMRGDEKYTTIDYLPEEKAKEYKNDFINLHNNWKTMETYDEFIYQEDNEIEASFGYIYMELAMPPVNTWYPMKYSESVEVELDEDDLTALNNIYALCESNDMDLLLYITPMDNIDVENQSYRYKIWQWADEHEVKYVDFVDKAEELDICMQVHNDGFHSSITGAGFMTDYLCNFINNNYEFDSHETNEMLEDLYVKEIDDYNMGFLNLEYNALKYLPRLINSTGTTIIRYNGSSYIDSELLADLKAIGVKEDFDPYGSYYCIIKDGVIIAEGDNYIDTDIDGHHFEVVNNSICCDYEEIDNSSDFTLVYYKENYDTHVVKHIDLNTSWDKEYDYLYQPR